VLDRAEAPPVAKGPRAGKATAVAVVETAASRAVVKVGKAVALVVTGVVGAATAAAAPHSRRVA
jgi:hypothetical protein